MPKSLARSAITPTELCKSVLYVSPGNYVDVSTLYNMYLQRASAYMSRQLFSRELTKSDYVLGYAQGRTRILINFSLDKDAEHGLPLEVGPHGYVSTRPLIRGKK